MIVPTIADLYLAYRQAKSALFFERRGVGLHELAAFEADLLGNLKALRSKLKQDAWFDNVSLGEVWIVPKRFRQADEAAEAIHRIGGLRTKVGQRPIDVQVRLSPHPEFAIVEVLYLWRFGAHLDAMLCDDVVGYRLNTRGREIGRDSRWLFEYWPKKYQEFRSAPLDAARVALDKGDETLIISADLANFYDTVAPDFLLEGAMTNALKENGASRTLVREYKKGTASLLRAYSRFRETASRRTALSISIGVPIGALTSRLVSNLALAPLDRHVASRPRLLCYRRYVDDFVIVARAKGDKSQLEVLRDFIPVRDETEEAVRLDAVALKRTASEFELQLRKIRVHRLAGIQGSDFVSAVAADFAKVVSERRAFIDPSAFLGDGLSHLIRAGNAEGSPLRVLRDADRTRLERFALSTTLRSLERVSSMIGFEEAGELVRTSLERVSRVLDSEGRWVDDLALAIRLLKLSICTGDWKSAKELQDRMDRDWGTIHAIQLTAGQLFYRNRPIDPRRTQPWIWLRNYLHELRLEAISSCLPIWWNEKQIANRFSAGVRVRNRVFWSKTLRSRAEALAEFDLRARDREDDWLVGNRVKASGTARLRKVLDQDAKLANRLALADKFVKCCTQLGDKTWVMTAEDLLLSTRPPSYFDVSRRWLYRVEELGFTDRSFVELLSVVNAIRGTAYADPVGSVVDQTTVSIESLGSGTPGDTEAQGEPRIILGNLVVPDSAWMAAATRAEASAYGRPELTKRRLQGLSEVLAKASSLSRRKGAEVLVLPELSLPRSWFRVVASHVAHTGGFGLVAGLEYIHHSTQHYVANQVFAVLPGPCRSVAVWPWTKRVPAREEGRLLSRLKTPLAFNPAKIKLPRTVIRSAWGTFSVLICSELIEARRVSDLLGRVDVVLCPAWNPDTASYDHLIQSAGFQLHAIIAIANNGHYSDCRAWAPRTERWERDLCRLIERDVNDVVHVDIPLSGLRAFHGGDKQVRDKYGRLRSAVRKGNKRAALSALQELADALPSDWRPLPPDWD